MQPNFFFRQICHYAATSTFINVRTPLNFSQVFDTKQINANTYKELKDKHNEPFKSTTDVSLQMIKSRLRDFCDIIHALPQMAEISMPKQMG
jgi:hypothetical protein